MTTEQALLPLATLLTLAACDSNPLEPELTPAPLPDVREYVTGEALADLDSNGHFRLSEPVVATPYKTLSGEQAKLIAVGVIRSFYTNPDVQTLPGAISHIEAAERVHGAEIRWDRIRAGDRLPYLAESHLEPLPDTVGNPLIRHVGPHYLVPFYTEATPVLVLAVSAYATNLRVDERGFLRWTDPLDPGGEFWGTGIPLVLDGVTMPPHPEVAVEFAYRNTGVKVAEVPVLGVPGNRVAPTQARWQVRLSDGVEFRRLVDDAVVVADVIYVGTGPSIHDARMAGAPVSSGAGLRLFVAAPEQPTEEPWGSTGFPIREGYAVDLHEVTVARP